MKIKDKVVDYTNNSFSSCPEPGYIPNNGYTILNSEELIRDEIKLRKEKDKIKNNDSNQDNKLGLFTFLLNLFKETKEEKLEPNYLKFITFCLSLLIFPSDLVQLDIDPFFG